MQLSSAAFGDQQPVPTPYTCDGPNTSPPLAFHDVPAGAASLVLMVEDVDAPAAPWVHWLVFNIPAGAGGFEAGRFVGTEGLANGGTFGYEGPCPRYFLGTHRYHFKLYALDKMLELPAEVDRVAVLAALEGHVLAEALLVGLAGGDGSAL